MSCVFVCANNRKPSPHHTWPVLLDLEINAMHYVRLVCTALNAD